jgi:hypothetical protein
VARDGDLFSALHPIERWPNLFFASKAPISRIDGSSSLGLA